MNDLSRSIRSLNLGSLKPCNWTRSNFRGGSGTPEFRPVRFPVWIVLLLVAGCAEHDGRTREGMTWAQERLFEGRKAELKERVDRGRLRLVEASLGEGARLHAAAEAFAAEIAALDDPDREVDVIELCRVRRGGES